VKGCKIGVVIVVIVWLAATTAMGAIDLVGRWALIIGNADYEHMNVDLQFPERDARFMADFLDRCCYFPAGNVQVLANCTFLETIEAFATLSYKLIQERAEFPEREQLVVIYYSGHGARVKDRNGDEEDDLDGAIVPVDADKDLALVITDDFLNCCLDQLGATQIIVILDCGQMGAQSLAAPGRLILAASHEGRCSWEAAELGHGVFTYFLLEGFRKGDEDGDGKVSLQEAFRYAQAKVGNFAKGEQEPEISGGIGEPILVLNANSLCVATVEEDMAPAGGAMSK